MYEFVISDITFIALILPQKVDSKAQHLRNKSKELNGVGLVGSVE